MSRSTKKSYTHATEGMKQWKKQANQHLRRNNLDEIGNGNRYRKLNDKWDSPGEHKGYWDDIRATRK